MPSGAHFTEENKEGDQKKKLGVGCGGRKCRYIVEREGRRDRGTDRERAAIILTFTSPLPHASPFCA
jgi:hypothetical protein